MKTTPDRRGAVMSEDNRLARGTDIKRRRLALGLDSVSQFAEATGADRETIGRIEDGTASKGTYERIEAWLDRMEARGPAPEGEPRAVRVALHGVYGIENVEVIFDAAASPDEMAARIRAIMSALKPSTGKDASVDKPGEQ